MIEPVRFDRWICPQCEEAKSSHGAFLGHLFVHVLESYADEENHRGSCWECQYCGWVFDSIERYNHHTEMCDPAPEVDE
jgi:rubredoxin